MRLVRPNCQGVNNPYHRLCASWPLLTYRGRVAVISQSGTVGAAMMDWFSEEKLGVSSFVATGNRADVDETDLIAPYAPSVPIEGLSKDEFSRIFRSSVEDKVAAAVTAANLKEAVAAALAPHIRDSVEKIVWEVAPDFVEKLLKEMLQASLASLSKEVEKVIWETVPDLAEGMIKKEIEKIKSEL